MDSRPDNLTPEEQRRVQREIDRFRAVVYRIINEPTEGSSKSVASILRRLDELKSCLDQLPLTAQAHRTPDKDKPSGPYIPLAHR